MTIKQLKSIYIYTVELQRLEEIISTLENEQVQAELIESYRKQLQDERSKVLAKKIEAEAYLSNIQDEEIKLIAKLRFIDLKSWAEIGRMLNYDRTAVYYKWRTYLQKRKKNDVSHFSRTKNSKIK